MEKNRLKCPECGETVLHKYVDGNIEVVIFKCLFAATLQKGASVEEAQKKLNAFKSSGQMEDWLKRGLF